MDLAGHDTERAPADPSGPVALSLVPPSADRAITPARAAGRALGAEWLHNALALTQGTTRTAKALGVSAQYVYALSVGSSGVKLGDLIAAPADVQRAIVRQWTERLEDAAHDYRAPLPHLAMRLTCEVGEVVGECERALRDGVVSEDERRDVLREIAGARAALDVFERAVRGGNCDGGRARR